MEGHVTRPSPSDEPHDKSGHTRQAILLAAAKLFKEDGYNATTMRRIANAASLEAGSIYYHFKSKDQILHEVLDIGVRQLYDEMKIVIEQARTQGTSFRQTFIRLVDIHLNFLLTRSDFTSAFARGLCGTLENFLAAGSRRRQSAQGHLGYPG